MATEDALGWQFALKEWHPGDPKHCLFVLLDRIQVGPHPRTEDEALRIMERLDEDGFRELVHVPSDENLKASGWSAKKLSLRS